MAAQVKRGCHGSPTGPVKWLEGFKQIKGHWARAGVLDLLLNVFGQQSLRLGACREPRPRGPVEIGHLASPVQQHNAVLQGIEQRHVNAHFHAATPGA